MPRVHPRRARARDAYDVSVDPPTQAALAALEDHDLGWFATQELDVVLGLLRS